jgi:hypothetical protein
MTPDAIELAKQRIAQSIAQNNANEQQIGGMQSAVRPVVYRANNTITVNGQPISPDSIATNAGIEVGSIQPAIVYKGMVEVNARPRVRVVNEVRPDPLPDFAILYSLVNGAKREFWLRTRSQEVKVLELDAIQTEEITLTLPSEQIGPIKCQTLASPGGTTQIVRQSNVWTNNTGATFVFQSTGFVSLTESGGNNPFIFIDCGAIVEILAQSPNSNNFSLEFAISVDASRGESNSNTTPSTLGSFSVAPSKSVIFRHYAGFVAQCPIETSIFEPDTYFSTGNLTSVGVAEKNLEYEAYLSSANGSPLIFIKYGWSADYTNIFYMKGKVSENAQALESPDLPASDPLDWRVGVINYNPGSASGNGVCVDQYSTTNDVLLKRGKVYEIDLDQDIEGQTLTSILEAGASGAVKVDVKVTPYTENGSCSLGDETIQTLNLKIPSQANTVEGIVFMG